MRARARERESVEQAKSRTRNNKKKKKKMSVSLMRGGAAPASAADVEVTYEDQLRVNEFSRNNARLNELTQEIKARKSSLETLTDAADECELATEEGDIKLVLGESFFNIDEEFAEQHLNSLMDVSCVVFEGRH